MADGMPSNSLTADDRVLRQEAKDVLDGARSRIATYTGLYTNENLIADVLGLCRAAATGVAPSARVREAYLLVEDRCRHLAKAADRYAPEQFDVVAASRSRAIAAVDTFQDVIVESRRLARQAGGPGVLLRRRAR